MIYVEVAIAKQHTGDKLFSYETSDSIALGSIVVVPFGRTSAIGIVIAKVKKPTFKTKPIKQILPYTLPKQSIDLMSWMFNFYAEDNGTISQLFVPSNFVAKPKKQLARTIIGKGYSLPEPTSEQANALDILSNANTTRALLHGDTGTGKTRVFVDIANQSLAKGRSVLILTPEIGLTPQLIDTISQHTSNPIVLTHSELTPVERRRVWEYALSGEKPTVFIGPRSALFLPINNLGLIVIDEAHDSSYKQGQSPRYQSLHVAAQLAILHNAKLIQSTATPNVDDYLMCKKSNYHIIRMKTPAAGQLSTTAEIIDMTNRDNFTKNPYISNKLLDAIEVALAQNEQVMLFLNRRGSARLVQCASCGWQAICPNCGIPLTYHHDVHTIRCHTCNFANKAPTSCPECQSSDLTFKSIGTKSLTELVQKIFPKSQIKRFDADSTATEQLHRNIDLLKNGDVDILVGTQLISKGIDLPNLSVVGVINADSGLNLPDYRAEELTFQQLYQVTGRVGRGHKLSKFFIQSRMPENPVMTAVLQRSWEQFYSYELHKRQQFMYPPYCFIAIAKITRRTSKGAENAALKNTENLSQFSGITVLGPSPSFFEKAGGYYTWQIIIKSHRRSLILQAIRSLPQDWIVDLDPSNLL